MKISSLEIQWRKWHFTPTSYEQVMKFPPKKKLIIYLSCLKFNSLNLHKNHSSSRERRVERRNGAPSLAHRKKEMGEKLKEWEFEKKRIFLPLGVQETCLEIWMKMVLRDLMQKVK